MRLFSFLISFFFLINSNAQTITNYTTADGLLDNFVECIDVDISDNIWFGTSIGAQMFDGTNWTSYNMTAYPGMVSNNIKVITAMNNGDIWIGTDYGASKFDGVNWVTFNSTNGLNNNQVYSIDEDNLGRVWVGTHAGVSYYNGSTWSSYGYPDLHWSGVNATAFDEIGDLWFASPLGGITHFNGAFTTYDTSNGLISQNVTSLLIDNYDNKWIGTGSGISVLDASNTGFIHHTKMYILSPPDTLNPVVDIAMDSWERKWTAIYVGYLAEGGVAYRHGPDWIDFGVTDGLVGPNVRGLAIDSENNVWIATSTGVSKISDLAISINSFQINKIIIYPNPSSGIITITSEENFKNIEVYNILGGLMHSEEVCFPNEIELNLSHLSSGIYHLVLTSENLVLNQKIIIE